MRLFRPLLYPVLGVLVFNIAVLLISPAQSAFQFNLVADPPPGVTYGFYPAERAPDQSTFGWTRAAFGLRLAGLNRRVEWRVTVRVRAAGTPGREVDVKVSVDGRPVPPMHVPNDFVERVITIAPAPAPGARLDLTVSNPFVPSASDVRELGVLIDWIRVEPTSPSIQRPSFATSFAGLCFGIIASVFVLPTAGGLIWIATSALAFGLITTHGFGPFVRWDVQNLALLAVVPTVGAALVLARSTLAPAGARMVVAITFAAAFIKLLVLSHPDMPIGDAVFHAHRFEDVLAGNYYFTSVTPGAYRFPYAIGLYVVAESFSSLARTVMQHVALLRIIVVTTDAFAAALLYRVITQWRNDEIAGGAAVLAYHLLPLSFSVITTGNLTNVFGQSVAMLVLIVLTSAFTTGIRVQPVAGPAPGSTMTRAALGESQPAFARLATADFHQGLLGTALIAALAGLAFLSHTSTFAVLSAQLLLTAGVLAASGEPMRRRVGLAVTCVTLLAIIIAVGVYYAHFIDVYRESFSRAATETGRATAAAGGRTPLMRLLDVPRLVNFCYVWTTLLIAGYGIFVVSRHPTRGSIVGLTLLTWLAVCLGFLVLGIITPVDMRHYLAALPVIAILTGVGFGHAWRLGGGTRWILAGLFAWTAWEGALTWIRILG